MLEARTVHVRIERPWRDVYEAFWHPTSFPAWASGLSGATMIQDGDVWLAHGPEGPVRIRFTPRNAYGVMDHVVQLENGTEIQVQLRMVAKDGGAEVQLTLFREPDMSDEKFAEDLAWVERDLQALRDLA